MLQYPILNIARRQRRKWHSKDSGSPCCGNPFGALKHTHPDENFHTPSHGFSVAENTQFKQYQIVLTTTFDNYTVTMSTG